MINKKDWQLCFAWEDALTDAPGQSRGQQLLK